MKHEWSVVEEKTQEHWLELEGKQFGEVWLSASAKWDGCVHFTRYYNTPKNQREPGKESEEDTDYIHICDIDEMIEDLQEIKRLAVEHFHGWEG